MLSIICSTLLGINNISAGPPTSKFICSFISAFILTSSFEYILLNKAGGNTHNRTSITNGLGKAFYVEGKSAGRGSVLQIFVTNNKIITKYIYYYLQSIEIMIKKMARYTTGLGTIKMEKISSIVIPVPSKEHQQIIIKQMEEKEALIKQLEKSIIDAKENIQIIMNGFLKNKSVTKSEGKTKKKVKKDISAAVAVLDREEGETDSEEEVQEEAVETESEPEVEMEVYAKKNKTNKITNKNKPKKITKKKSKTKNIEDECIEI